MHPDFEKNGFLIARNFFNETTVRLMQSYFNIKLTSINYNEEERSKHGFTTIEDGDVTTSFTYYADHLVESISLNHGQKISTLLGLNLSPTYSFARIYEKGSRLIPHTDRPSCEISVTCPVLTYNNTPSTIFISNVIRKDNEPNQFSIEEIHKRGGYTQVDLYPGDVLFYKGCERYHWRDKLESDYLIQFFMHFVQSDGLSTEWIYDKRPFVGFQH